VFSLNFKLTMVSFIPFFLLSSVASANVWIFPEYELSNDHINLEVDKKMEFTYVEINDNGYQFNSSRFYVTNDFLVSIMLSKYCPNPGLGNDAIVFDVNNTGGDTVVFSIGGFNTNDIYHLKRDGAIISLISANDTGFLYFSDTIWNDTTISLTCADTFDDIDQVSSVGMGRSSTWAIIGLMGAMGIIVFALFKKRRRRY